MNRDNFAPPSYDEATKYPSGPIPPPKYVHVNVGLVLVKFKFI